jgi:hypothetical protein
VLLLLLLHRFPPDFDEEALKSWSRCACLTCLDGIGAAFPTLPERFPEITCAATGCRRAIVIQQQQSSLLDQLDTTFIKYGINATCTSTSISGGAGPPDMTVIAFKQVGACHSPASWTGGRKAGILHQVYVPFVMQVAGLWVILAISVGVSLLLLALNLWWSKARARQDVAETGDVERQVVAHIQLGPVPGPEQAGEKQSHAACTAAS